MTTQRLVKTGLVVAVLLGGVAAWQAGLLDEVAPTVLSERLQSWGVWGWLAVLGGWALLQPFGVSGWIWLMAATLTWSAPVAMAVTLVGSLLSALTCFGFARFIARDWVAQRVPERFTRYEDRLRASGLRTVTVLRLVFFCSPPLQLAMGVSAVRFRDYVVGTVVGNLPYVIGGVLLGERVLAWVFSD